MKITIEQTYFQSQDFEAPDGLTKDQFNAWIAERANEMGKPFNGTGLEWVGTVALDEEQNEIYDVS